MQPEVKGGWDLSKNWALSVDSLIFFLVWFIVSSFWSFDLLFGSLIALISPMHAVNINLLSHSHNKSAETKRKSCLPVWFAQDHVKGKLEEPGVAR